MSRSGLGVGPRRTDGGHLLVCRCLLLVECLLRLCEALLRGVKLLRRLFLLPLQVGDLLLELALLAKVEEERLLELRLRLRLAPLEPLELALQAVLVAGRLAKQLVRVGDERLGGVVEALGLRLGLAQDGARLGLGVVEKRLARRRRLLAQTLRLCGGAAGGGVGLREAGRARAA